MSAFLKSFQVVLQCPGWRFASLRAVGRGRGGRVSPSFGAFQKCRGREEWFLFVGGQDSGWGLGTAHRVAVCVLHLPPHLSSGCAASHSALVPAAP